MYTFEYVYLKVKKTEKNQLSQGSIKIAQNKSKEIKKKEGNNKNINQEGTKMKSRNDDKIKVGSLNSLFQECLREGLPWWSSS